MKKRFWLPVKTGLLSYSAMSKFQECPRRYAFDYIDKPEVESEEGTGLLRGRAFHHAIEVGDASDFGSEHGLDDLNQALVRAAAKRYLIMKDSFPPVTHKEQKIINEEEQFFGKCDEMTVDEESGNWMLGEMKTGGKFDPVAYAIAETKPQTALYKAMSVPFCSERFLSHKDFAGLSFKQIVFPYIKPLKGRGKNAVPETMEDFELRAFDKTMILHKIIKVQDQTVANAVYTFRHVLASIDHLGPRSENYPRNCQACNHPWFGLCAYFEICHGIKLDLGESIGSDIDTEDAP